MLAYNPKRPPFFKEFVPPTELYEEYFDSLVSSGKVYICVITGMGRKFSVYTETSERETVCRVFYSREDAEYFKEMIAIKEKISHTVVNIWECQIPDLIDFLIKLSEKNVVMSPPKYVRAVGSIIYGNDLQSIDTFWTSTPEFVV